MSNSDFESPETEADLDLINRYLSGDLSPEERKVVDDRLVTDEAFFDLASPMLMVDDLIISGAVSFPDAGAALAPTKLRRLLRRIRRVLWPRHRMAVRAATVDGKRVIRTDWVTTGIRAWRALAGRFGWLATVAFGLCAIAGIGQLERGGQEAAQLQAGHLPTAYLFDSREWSTTSAPSPAIAVRAGAVTLAPSSRLTEGKSFWPYETWLVLEGQAVLHLTSHANVDTWAATIRLAPGTYDVASSPQATRVVVRAGGATIESKHTGEQWSLKAGGEKTITREAPNPLTMDVKPIRLLETWTPPTPERRMLLLSPRVLLCTAQSYLALGEDRASPTERGQLVDLFLAQVREPANADWDAAFVHHVGYWSHYDPWGEFSSWPLPPVGDRQALARYAAERHVLLTDAPEAGDVFLQYSRARKEFTRCGIVVDRRGSGLLINGEPYVECTVIEGNSNWTGTANGTRVVRITRKLCVSAGDRIIRWVHLDPRRPLGNPAIASQLVAGRLQVDDARHVDDGVA